MSEDHGPTSDAAELTPEVLARLAAEAEAGYDLRRLRARRHVPDDSVTTLGLDRLVLRAVVGNIQPSLLILAGLHSWLAVNAAAVGLPPTATPLEEWSTAATELFAPAACHAVFLDGDAAPVQPEVVSSALAAATPQERHSAVRTLVAVSTFLSATALQLSDEIDEAPASWSRPTDWEEGLRAVIDTAMRFQAALQPHRLEEILTNLLCAAK